MPGWSAQLRPVPVWCVTWFLALTREREMTAEAANFAMCVGSCQVSLPAHHALWWLGGQPAWTRRVSEVVICGHGNNLINNGQ
jgi:hypothetical protein